MKPFFFGLSVLIFCLQVHFFSVAQQSGEPVELPDSVKEKEHSPTKATIMSACLPGLGQIYNKKYWKVPVIYTGFAVLGYFIYFNVDEYLNYKCAYIESSYGNYNGSYSYLTQRYSAEELLSGREYYRRNLEISCLLTAVWYGLNILDATVDAHLFTYNISDELAVKIEPHVFTYGRNLPAATPGLSLKIIF
jgi:hypothetical protein